MSFPVSMGALLKADLQEDAASRDEGLCVVGIFGKSNMQPGPPKESIINNLADKHIFSLFGGPEDGGNADSHIQAFYSQENRVLYLLLSSVCDSRQLLRACESLSAATGHSDAHDFWKGLDRQHCLHLLYMFSVCHVLLLVHPNQTFDVTYDRLFRALDALRQKVLPLIRAAIKDCPVSKEWKVNCRPCPPRLLFVFQMNGSLKVWFFSFYFFYLSQAGGLLILWSKQASASGVPIHSGVPEPTDVYQWWNKYSDLLVKGPIL